MFPTSEYQVDEVITLDGNGQVTMSSNDGRRAHTPPDSMTSNSSALTRTQSLTLSVDDLVTQGDNSVNVFVSITVYTYLQLHV